MSEFTLEMLVKARELAAANAVTPVDGKYMATVSSEQVLEGIESGILIVNGDCLEINPELFKDTT